MGTLDSLIHYVFLVFSCCVVSGNAYNSLSIAHKLWRTNSILRVESLGLKGEVNQNGTHQRQPTNIIPLHFLLPWWLPSLQVSIMPICQAHSRIENAKVEDGTPTNILISQTPLFTLAFCLHRKLVGVNVSPSLNASVVHHSSGSQQRQPSKYLHKTRQCYSMISLPRKYELPNRHSIGFVFRRA